MIGFFSFIVNKFRQTNMLYKTVKDIKDFFEH